MRVRPVVALFIPLFILLLLPASELCRGFSMQYVLVGGIGGAASAIGVRSWVGGMVTCILAHVSMARASRMEHVSRFLGLVEHVGFGR